MSDDDPTRPARPARPARPGKPKSKAAKSKRSAKTRRRQRERPLQIWRGQILAIDAEIRGGLGIGEDDVIPQQRMVDEVVLLGDARSFRGLDVVIPAGRVNLVQAWIAARLSRVAMTPEERRALAERVAPLPDEQLYLHHFDPKTGKAKYKLDGTLHTYVHPDTGITVHRPLGKFQEEVEQALRSYLAGAYRADSSCARSVRSCSGGMRSPARIAEGGPAKPQAAAPPARGHRPQAR